MRIAVVLPVFRRPRLVLEALGSVAAQTRPPDRLVVVDDGSGDGTAEGVQRWLGAAPRPWPAEVLRQERRGVSEARNRGAERAADCGALAFLDSDNLLEPRFLERMVEALEREPCAVAATCDRWVEDARTGARRAQRMARFDRATAADLLRLGPSGMTNTVVRAESFRAVGGFDPGLAVAEDFHLMLRLGLRGHWVHVPGLLSVRREHAGEEPALGSLHADRRLLRAEALERFLFRDGGADALPERRWRYRLSRSWTAAARSLVRLGRTEEARACAARARELWWWNVVAWLQTGRAWVQEKRRSATGA